MIENAIKNVLIKLLLILILLIAIVLNFPTIPNAIKNKFNAKKKFGTTMSNVFSTAIGKNANNPAAGAGIPVKDSLLEGWLENLANLNAIPNTKKTQQDHPKLAQSRNLNMY
ncbi:MAG: hypothetical protein KDC90_11105, partial [Ignavibacteriae bacterium]|nr:hypothetical protein [Ignavibacteriota bacterium]